MAAPHRGGPQFIAADGERGGGVGMVVARQRDPPGEGVKRQECRFPEKAVATGKMPVVPESRQDGGSPYGWDLIRR